MKILTSGITAILLTALQGCASLSGNPGNPDSLAATIPDADPMLDHYIAWVPRNKAQTATVAEAVTHISLAQAMEQTARQLCGGNWVMNGQVTENIGPFPATAPDTAGAYPAWYYRISHRPGLRGCPGTGSEKLYQALQENLPEWVDIRTASKTSLSLLQ